MIVIIAEKPSLGRTIANALPDSFSKHDGYLLGKEYAVTWGFGHLFELKDIEEYRSDYDPTRKYAWKDTPLPFYPDHPQHRLKRKPKSTKTDEGVKKQFQIITKLINDPQTSEIVSAGDADREGEVIIRLILYSGLKSQKSITRLWLPDQTPATIQKAMRERKPDSEYDNLYKEGIARQVVDWIIGINLTREMTLRVGSGSLFNVGRVLCPIVEAVYERDKAIREFVPKTYYGIEQKLSDSLKIVSKYKYDEEKREGADKHAAFYNQYPIVVESIEKKEKKELPNKLFSLSKLQGFCGKKYKYKPKETLEIVQKLYESGYVSYPRTNTEYLAEEEKGKVQQILKNYSEYPVTFVDSKRIFNSDKIESHSALTPTFKRPNLESLNEKERNVYQAIEHRFLANFWSEPRLLQETKATFQIGGGQVVEHISLTGTIIVQKGWEAIDPNVTQRKELPPLSQGQTIASNFCVVEKKTSPPAKYTVESLNTYLLHPFKKDGMTEEEEYEQLFAGVEIGTEATRADTIDRAIHSQYIDLKNNTYSILPKGEYMIETLKKVGIDLSPMRTVELQKSLKKVYRQEMTVNAVIEETKDLLNTYFDHKNDTVLGSFQGGSKEPIGHCPWCGKPLYEKKGKFGTYYAHDKNVDCSFHLSTTAQIYKNKVSLTPTRVKNLLEGKSFTATFKSATKGTDYKVKVFLSKEPNVWKGKQYPQFVTEYVQSKK